MKYVLENGDNFSTSPRKDDLKELFGTYDNIIEITHKLPEGCYLPGEWSVEMKGRGLPFSVYEWPIVEDRYFPGGGLATHTLEIGKIRVID